jgi:histidine triad (HIT) family protein
MIPSYDDNNVFAKILRGEIPAKVVFQNDEALAFYDINPLASVHILVIPKGKYVSYEDFCLNASRDTLKGFNDCINKVLEITKIGQTYGGNGFRIISNIGHDGGQEVPHYHVHILGGEKLGSMLGQYSKL